MLNGKFISLRKLLSEEIRLPRTRGGMNKFLSTGIRLTIDHAQQLTLYTQENDPNIEVHKLTSTLPPIQVRDRDAQIT